MKLANRGWRAIVLLAAWTVPAVYGQTPAAEQKAPAPPPAETKKSEAPWRRVALGFRVRTLPAKSFSVMDNGRALNTYTVSKVPYDWNYTTTAHSFPIGGGLAIEAPISQRALLTIDVVFTRLRYDKVTNVYWGTDDPTTSADERSHITVTENTKARVFDLPVLVHHNLRPTGFLSHFYLAAGPTARLVSNVSTTNNTTYADGTKANNRIAAPVSRRTLIGGTVGAGFRFVDEFNIKVTPEVRYTRWAGASFSQDSTVSPRNQLEISLGFSR